MSFPRYPNYKDSGVEWLGEAPGHWDVTQLKRVVNPDRQITYGIVQAGPHVQDGIPYIRPADMTDEQGVFAPDEIMRTSQEIASSYSRSTILTGDLVCSIGPSFGKVMVTPAWLNGANLTQGTARIAVHEPHDARYLFWTLRSPLSVAQWESSVGGATFRALNLGPLAETTIPVPSGAEQTQIAAFLDRETAKIDALVAEQRRLMELLKEKRQAVISHAVTQGLNPDAPMKPSGIEWLGDVPEHWHYGCLKYLATVKTGYAFSSDHFVGEGIPALRIGDITTDGNVDFTDARCLPEEYGTEHADVLVVRGDIVMAMTGATIGKTGWYDSDRPALLNQRVCIFRSIAPNEQRYLWHILSARFYAEHIALAAVGGAQPNISDSQLLQCVVPLPPGPEQVAIAAFLDTETAKFDTLTAEAQRAIDLLQERRTALISAAVTGQIDVRQLTEKQAA
jgi:type I restriction enzyme S subunit